MSVPYSDVKKRLMVDDSSATLISGICSWIAVRPSALTTVSKPVLLSEDARLCQELKKASTFVHVLDFLFVSQIASDDLHALILSSFEQFALVRHTLGRRESSDSSEGALALDYSLDYVAPDNSRRSEYKNVLWHVARHVGGTQSVKQSIIMRIRSSSMDSPYYIERAWGTSI